MNTQNNMTIVEAVEALSTIADLDFDKELGVLHKEEIRHGENLVTYKTVQWLKGEQKEEGLRAVTDVFGTVLRYLKEYYENDTSIKDPKTVDRIKIIMVLVGEAAKKIDKYGKIFQKSNFHSVTESKEYKTLQEFYHRQISHTIDEGMLGRWILGITRQAWADRTPIKKSVSKAFETQHVFIDLESVKKDADYDLFSIRKEDGTRFFSPKLIRNIKLVSDFGATLSDDKRIDFLADLSIWQDRYLNHIAKEIIHETNLELNHFFKEIFRFKDHELVATIAKSIFALFLSAQNENVASSNKKSAKGYFRDFMIYFKTALNSREYQKLIAYPPKKGYVVGQGILNVTESLARALYMSKRPLDSIAPLVRHLVDEGGKMISQEHNDEKSEIWSTLATSWQAMSKIMKHHPHGPLGKIIQAIENGDYNVFEPLSFENLPQCVFSLYVGGHKTSFVRISSPTTQESTVSAEVIPHFRAFCKTGHKNLIISLQDRTSWRECARAFAIEGLQDKATVVTLATDTDFYHQVAPYYEGGRWDVFSDHLLDQTMDSQSGFYFSDSIREKMEAFIPKAIESLHSLFFKNKNVMTREERLVFIDIFYLVLTLKAIDIVGPDRVAIACKDGLDTGNLFTNLISIFFQTLADEKITAEKLAQLQVNLFGPVLLTRERMPLADRFQRMLHVVRHLEEVKNDLGFERYQTLVKQTLGILFHNKFSDAYLS